MYSYSQALLDQYQNHLHVGRAKHVDVQHHSVKQCMHDGDVSLQHVCSREMIADIVTKPLPVELFEHCRSGLGMCERW